MTTRRMADHPSTTWLPEPTTRTKRNQLLLSAIAPYLGADPELILLFWVAGKKFRRNYRDK